jgi:hypothetical protein
MSACRPKRGSITEAIKDGIARRGFYIVPTPEEVPGCTGSKAEKLECIQRFARDNGWNVAVHNGNGWLLFAAHASPVADDFENDLGQLAELIESSLR